MQIAFSTNRLGRLQDMWSQRRPLQVIRDF
jgi:hypothetical protein